MLKRQGILFLGLLATFVGPCSAASVSPRPPPGPDEVQAAFDSGFDAGYVSGSNDATTSCQSACDATINQVQSACDATLAQCQSDPLSCGISLGSCLAAPIYGETEPNDNIVTADPLLLDTKFWGQSYGIDDADWFYVVSNNPNQTLTLNFSRLGSTPLGWILNVRDAAGNRLASFNTGSVQGSTSDNGDITYRLTLGLVGTYYIEVKPDPLAFSFEPYYLAALLQDSPLMTGNFVAGFADVEIEPNDVPFQPTIATTGVAMYGIINLMFPPQAAVVPDPDGDGFEYLQGETDWFVFPSKGNEIVTLSVCSRSACGAGQWLFQVFDAVGAVDNWSGAPDARPPLLSFNSEAGNPAHQSFGINDPGDYFIRVQHRRLLTAQCLRYGVDVDSDGETEDLGCSCDPGEAQCSTEVALGTAEGVIVTTTADGNNYVCPNGSLGDFLGNRADDEIVVRCNVDCRCNETYGQITLPGDALTSPYNFTYFNTRLPPSTANSGAMDDFDSRPSPF